MHIDLNAQVVDVVVGYDAASPSAFGAAAFAPLLNDARGIALDPIDDRLVITEAGTGELRFIGLDPDEDGVIDDPAGWTNTSLPTSLVSPAGIAFDAADGTFVVVEEGNHCVRRVDRTTGTVLATVHGRCGVAGVFLGFLQNPTHVAISPTSGAVYVSDTSNNKVVRIDADGSFSVILGDGSASSAGEGGPARLFPVQAPRALTLDGFGNLYVTSTTTVRIVANVDGDLDADGDDDVFTIYGSGDRLSFPESDSFCMSALSVDDDGVVYAADACQGLMVRIERTIAP